MGKFFNSDYEEVEAFTQEELDAKLKEAQAKFESDAATKVAELEKQKADAEAAKTKLEEKLTKRSEEYNNLKAKFEETGNKLNATADDKKAAYEKLRDSMIERAAGDDTEYAEKLRERYAKIGSETLDPTVLEKDLKDAHTLALSDLNREITSFSMADIGTSRPPVKDFEKKQTDFTETDEGKATLNMAFAAMGMTPASAETKNNA